MAARFLVAGGDGLWNNTNNWSATTGGASGASFPVAGDTVAFDSNSGNAAMTVNVASACASLVMSGSFAGTLTLNAQLTVSGTITFVSACTLAGTTGPLVANATATLTSGGKTIPCPLIFGATATYTLADNWTVTGLVTAGVTTGTTTINGVSKTLTCNGGFHQAGTTATVSGTVTLVLGGGTWDSSSTGRLFPSVNLAGNVTVSGAITIGNPVTLTYVSGTVTTTGSTLILNGGGTVTFNTAGVTWDSINITSANSSLSSDLAWSGTLSVIASTTFSGTGALSGTGAVTLSNAITVTLNNTGGLVTTGALTLPNVACTFAGSAGFTVGTLTTATLTASRIHTLTFGNTYTVTGSFRNVGCTSTVRQAIKSSSAGNKVVLTVGSGATLGLAYCDPTDVDSSAGRQVVSINGVISNTDNWSSTLTAASTVSGPVIGCRFIRGIAAGAVSP